MEDGALILVAGALLALGTLMTLAAGRLRVPGLVLFLLLGMAIGSDGLALIEFDDAELTRTIGVIALGLILFEGGFAAGWKEIGPVFGTGVALATVGTLLTALLTGLAAMLVLDRPLLEGLLLGSVVAASDSAAIFSVLRGSKLERRLARTLEAESGFNDPIGILLVIGFIDWIQEPGYGVLDMAGLVAVQLPIGALAGLAIGRLAVLAFTRVDFPAPGLYPVASLGAAALAYGLADTLHGSGFLAVYVAGIVLGSARQLPARRTVGEFHIGVAWVSQIALFVTLGLLVFPSELIEIAPEGLAISAALMLVARPVAAWAATVLGGYSWRESLLLGWAGLRGAVPMVFATFPVIEGVPDAGTFFNIVFFVVLTSTLIQGATVEPLARWLDLVSDEPAVPRAPIEVGRIRELQGDVIEFHVAEGDAVVGRVVNELGLPRESLVVLIVRQGQVIPPRGSTVMQADDRLNVLVVGQFSSQVEALTRRWREGPVGAPDLPLPLAPGRPSIFSARPWLAHDGDPSEPLAVGGTAVARRLRTRRGTPGALVQLEDGRYAATGDGVVAVGGSRQLALWCRDRIGRTADRESRAWWQEVAGVMAERSVR